MGSLDYGAIAQRLETRTFNEKEISEFNKTQLRNFLTIYDVSDGRRCVFLMHIRHLLRAFPDVHQALTDRDGVNSFFGTIRRRYAAASYDTIIKVSLRFVRWLNDGERPAGFRDIRAVPRKKTMRELNPDDMMTWEDALGLLRLSNRIQIKAVLLTQLDGGFRPSELLHLKYGDVKLRDRLAIVHVGRGKTGKRTVVLYRATATLKQWLEQHPTQNPCDPLWVDEQKTIRALRNGKPPVRYDYAAIINSFRRLAKRAGFTKPVDAYSLRHSSCALDKKSNVPIDLAAERHGHSVKFYTEVYGRLSTDDLVRRFQDHLGIADPSDTPADNSSTAATTTAAEMQQLPATDLQKELEEERKRRSALEQQMNADRESMRSQLDEIRRQMLDVATREIRENRITS